MADKDEKTQEPTAKRLEEARKKGEIVYSQEAATWIMLAAGAGGLAMFGAPMAGAIGRLLIGFFSNAADIPTDGEALRGLFAALALKIGAALGAFMLLMITAGIVARVVQDKITWAPERLAPKLEKLNPANGFSRVFGTPALAAFGKAALKFVIVGAAAAWALWPRDSSLETEPFRDLAAFWPMAVSRAQALLGACLVAFGAIALADYFFTRQSYMKRLRMSREEIKEEQRQSEGDPLVRQKLRRIRMERGRRRMMEKVPKATVIVTNPTHYAVALRYEAGETAAPVCVAKGVDELALRIRAVADEANVPIVEDPPLARALYATVELDEAIPREHYEAVAKVIGVVMRLAAQKRARPARPAPNRAT